MSIRAKKPEIRFKGFTADWEQRKLGEIGDTYTGLSGKSKEDFGHGEGKFVTYMNVFSNTISNPRMTEQVEIDGRQNKVQVGDVFFTTSSETPEEVGISSVWLENSDDTYLNSFCFGYRPREKFDNYFLAYMLRSTTTRKKIAFLAQGISRYNISKNKVMEITVPKPKIVEQEQIGRFFTDLDDLIILHQQKYEKLIMIKQSMLEKMFPKAGSNVPEIRFKGFSDPWEQRKFSEFFIHLKNNSLSRADLNYERGSVKNIHYGDVLIKFAEILDVQNEEVPYVSNDEFDINGTSLLQDGDIIIADAAEDETVGKCSEIRGVMDLNVVSGLHTIPCRPTKPFATGYLGYYMNSTAYHDQLLPLIQGSKISSISKSALQNTDIIYPSSEDEQRQIGAYFNNLDNLITLHQRKHEKLKNIKLACMEKMFV